MIKRNVIDNLNSYADWQMTRLFLYALLHLKIIKQVRYDAWELEII